MDELPGYISIVFILTTFATLAFFLQAIRAAGLDRLHSKILLFLLPLWIFFQAALALGGFYLDAGSRPPRIMLFGVLPTVLLILSYFVFFRTSFIDRLPLGTLTLLHVIRVPVEIVLYWLFLYRQVPAAITFSGMNYDIASGLLAPIAYFAAIRGGSVKRWVLIVYNLLGLTLLATIVSIAVMSLQSPLQRMAFEQPNRAVLFFPYVWLPTIVVPIVLFAHLSSLWKLFAGRNN
jgi:hypothetical protein